MGFQTSVSLKQGFGVVGEMYSDAPRKAQSFILNSASAANNVVGRAFTVASEGVAQAGVAGSNTVRFAGILASPKTYANKGTTGDTLAANQTLANGVQAELVSEGDIIVALPAAAAIGDVVYYTDATGVLTTTQPGAAAPGASTLIRGAYVNYFALAGAGLAVITLSPNSRANT